jgi:hypothetical protein
MLHLDGALFLPAVSVEESVALERLSQKVPGLLGDGPKLLLCHPCQGSVFCCVNVESDAFHGNLRRKKMLDIASSISVRLVIFGPSIVGDIP